MFTCQQAVLDITLASPGLNTAAKKNALRIALTAVGMSYAYRSTTRLLAWRSGAVPTVPGNEAAAVQAVWSQALAGVTGVTSTTVTAFVYTTEND